MQKNAHLAGRDERYKSHLNHSAAWLPVELGSMALRHQVSLVLPFSKIFLLLFSRLHANLSVETSFTMDEYVQLGGIV